MKKLLFRALGVLLAILVALPADAQEAGRWYRFDETDEIDLVIAVWQTPNWLAQIGCSRALPGLWVKVASSQLPEANPNHEVLFIRAGGIDHVLDWNLQAYESTAKGGWLELVLPQKARAETWAGQGLLIGALEGGADLQLMSASRSDLVDARELGRFATGADGGVFTDIRLTCGGDIALAQTEPQPAQSSGLQDWSVIPGTQHWASPTAVRRDRTDHADLLLTCGGDARPLMAVQHDDFPNPVGQIQLPGRVDGQAFDITWTGWKNLAISNPANQTVNLLRAGRLLTLVAGDGRTVEFSLSGAGQAIDIALVACFVADPVAPDAAADPVPTLGASSGDWQLLPGAAGLNVPVAVAKDRLGPATLTLFCDANRQGFAAYASDQSTQPGAEIKLQFRSPDGTVVSDVMAVDWNKSLLFPVTAQFLHLLRLGGGMTGGIVGGTNGILVVNGADSAIAHALPGCEPPRFLAEPTLNDQMGAEGFEGEEEPAPPPGTEQPVQPANSMTGDPVADAFLPSLQAKVESECRAGGATGVTIDPSGISWQAHPSGRVPTFMLYYRGITCTGSTAIGFGAGFCDGSKCLFQTYSRDGDGFRLTEQHYQ